MDRDGSDPYGKKARSELTQAIRNLPLHTAQITEALLKQPDFVQHQIEQMEHEIRELVQDTPEMDRSRSLPGIEFILSAVIALEVGDMGRFPSAERYVSYAGTTPRVHASGDKVRYGRLRPDVNRYLRWAYIEAAHSLCLHEAHYPLGMSVVFIGGFENAKDMGRPLEPSRAIWRKRRFMCG